MTKNKRNLVYLIVIIVLFLVPLLLVGCNISEEDKSYFDLTYSSVPGGTIYGVQEQKIKVGQSGSLVTAVAEVGYKFECWSDDLTTESRIDKEIQDNLYVTAKFVETQRHHVSYSCIEGGFIEGEVNQKIIPGQITKYVNAVPYDGYYFDKWSDGNKNELRNDKDIHSDFEVIAIFKLLEFNVRYSSNGGGLIEGNLIQKVKFGCHSNIVTAVPIDGYEFLSWSDGVTEDKRLDLNIKTDIDVRAIFAPYDANKHKILMVFATEIEANLLSKDNELISVNYKITDIEKKIYELTAIKLEAQLNDTFKGETFFEVDVFFTKIPLNEKNLHVGSDPWYSKTYGLMAKDIPEIKGIVANYRSVITTFSLNDYQHKLHIEAGSAGKESAYIHAESLFASYFANGRTLEDILELNERASQDWWEYTLELYLHEFAHTAEAWYWYNPDLMTVGLHEIMSYYEMELKKTKIEGIKDFLINKAYYKGEVVGIPESYWIEKPIL